MEVLEDHDDGILNAVCGGLDPLGEPFAVAGSLIPLAFAQQVGGTVTGDVLVFVVEVDVVPRPVRDRFNGLVEQSRFADARWPLDQDESRYPFSLDFLGQMAQHSQLSRPANESVQCAHLRPPVWDSRGAITK